MNLSTILLQAAAPTQSHGAQNYSGILVLLVIGFIIYYFVKIRPEKKNLNQVNQIQTKPLADNNLKWYQKPVTVILFLIFFFPVGLFFMWKNEIWTKSTRVVISIFFGLLVIANANKNNLSNLNKSNHGSNNSSNCSKLDNSGSFRSIVKDRLESSGKIPQLVEFNGNGQYFYQAYDLDHEITFGGTMTVNECGQIIGVSTSIN